MIPGTQPQRVKMNTITKDPHPLSTTANGGNKIESKTRQILMVFLFKLVYNYRTNFSKKSYNST